MKTGAVVVVVAVAASALPLPRTTFEELTNIMRDRRMLLLLAVLTLL